MVAAACGFLARYFDGVTCEEEQNTWHTIINQNKTVCTEALKENEHFWRYMIEKSEITASKVRGMVEKISSLECRALLLEYLMECAE